MSISQIINYYHITFEQKKSGGVNVAPTKINNHTLFEKNTPKSGYLISDLLLIIKINAVSSNIHTKQSNDGCGLIFYNSKSCVLLLLYEK